MNYDEMQALENYKKQAQATLAVWLRDRVEVERVAAERRERERVEKLALIKANLQQIVPPALWPLARIDEEGDVHAGVWHLPFFYADQEIMRLEFYVNANMTVEFCEITVPDARLGECFDEESGGYKWYADMVYKNITLCIETTEGARYGTDRWEFATARAFEVLEAYREYERRATQHNAELTERRAENQIIKQVFGADTAGKDTPAEANGEAEAAPAFTVIKDEDLVRFARNVNDHLRTSWVLYGPMQVVAVPPDPRYEDLERFLLYVQALVRPEVV